MKFQLVTFGFKLMNESRLLRKPRFFYTIDNKNNRSEDIKENKDEQLYF